MNLKSRANRGDIATSLVLIGVGLYVIIQARGYPGSIVGGAPGPAFFPQLLGASLIILSSILGISTIRRRAAKSEPEFRWEGLGRIGGVVILTTIYLSFLPSGDFYLTTPPLLLAVMAIMGERRVWVLLLVPVAFVLFVYAIFYRIFGVILPSVFI